MNMLEIVGFVVAVVVVLSGLAIIGILLANWNVIRKDNQKEGRDG